jgi:hypothetical protein
LFPNGGKDRVILLLDGFQPDLAILDALPVFGIQVAAFRGAVKGNSQIPPGPPE